MLIKNEGFASLDVETDSRRLEWKGTITPDIFTHSHFQISQDKKWKMEGKEVKKERNGKKEENIHSEKQRMKVGKEV